METNQTQGSRVSFSWMLFDWATMPFFVLVLTFVFGPYYSGTLAENPISGQISWGWAVGAAGLLVAFLAPILGAIADASGQRKPMMAAFSILVVVGCSLLFFGAPDAPQNNTLVLISLAAGVVGIRLATVFNNAQITDVAQNNKVGDLSGRGVALGNLAGILVVIFALGFLIADAQTGLTLLGFRPVFGLTDIPFIGQRLSGPIAAVWYAIFVLPLFVLLKEKPTGLSFIDALKTGSARLLTTLKSLPERRSYLAFLLSLILYRDGINALYTFGGIYAAGVLGLSIVDVGIFGIIAICFGAIGGLVAARLDAWVGARRAIIYGCVSLAITCLFVAATSKTNFLGRFEFEQNWIPIAIYYTAGAIAGLTTNIVQASSRTLLTRQVAPDAVTEAFGLYALASRMANFLSPILIAWITLVTQNQQFGLLPIVFMLLAGAFGLRWVRPA